MIKFFIGIDFSKKTFDATIIERNKLDDKGIHCTFTNSLSGMKRFLSWVAGHTYMATSDDLLFCAEDTGLYSRVISDALSESGYFIWLESALRIKRSLGISREKNDKKDSRDIAVYASRYQDKATRYVVPDERLEAIKALFMRRRFLKEQLRALKCRNKEMQPILKRNKLLGKSFRSDDRLGEAYRKEITSIEKEIRELINSSKELKQTFLILTSMKGIALVNATALIVYTANFKKFDYDARRIAFFWGVAPFGQASGTSLHVTPHVSHYADKYLKSLLTEAVLCAMKFCPIIKSYAEKLLARGKHPNIVKNNAKNKMLHILVAMVRDGKVFQDTNERKIA